MPTLIMHICVLKYMKLTHIDVFLLPVSILNLTHNSKTPIMGGPEYDNYESFRQMTTSLTRSWQKLQLVPSRMAESTALEYQGSYVTTLGPVGKTANGSLVCIWEKMRMVKQKRGRRGKGNMRGSKLWLVLSGDTCWAVLCFITVD